MTTLDRIAERARQNEQRMTRTTPPRPRGRPPMAPDQARTARVEIRTTQARRAQAARLAAAAGLSLSGWWEQAVDRASGTRKKPALVKNPDS